MRLLTLALLAMSVSIAPAFADGVVQNLITKPDKARLDAYADTRAAALAETREGNAAEVAELDASLALPEQSFSGLDLTGNWKCRTIKAGGLAKLVIYDWFNCKVTDDGSGWLLEKTSGSQRTKGRFYTDSDTRQIYLGSFFVSGDAPKPYGAGPDSDQVGYAFRTGPETWRIELPAPRYESKLDILEFRR